MANFLYTAIFAPVLLLPAALAARVTNPSKVPKNAVLLSKVSALTLRAGKLTAARRGPAIPQLNCDGPADVCSLYAVDVMRCTNEGADYDSEDVQWSCKASLPEEFKLGSTDVSCEGYESSQDPYVLKGSCAVEYRLLLTEKGEAKYGHLNDNSGWSEGDGKVAGGVARGIFGLVFVAVLFIILRAFWQSWRRGDRGEGGRRVGGGGGGGGGNDDDPPPPYDPYDSPPPKKTDRRSYAPRFNAGSTRTYGTNAGQGQQGWRPGVWTGAAAGAAAGYMAGNRGQTRQPETQQRPGAASGLFGGGRSGGSWGSQPSSSSSSSSPSYSSSRHESTGFGSTSRR